MHVEVRYFLRTVLAHVGEQTITLCFEAKVLRNLADRAHEADNLIGTRIRTEVGERYVLALWNYQDMHGCQRIDVMERQRPLVLIHFSTRNLATQDTGEDVAVVVGRQSHASHG